MVSITIRNVEPSVRDALADRAHRSGKSLQEYVHGLLTETAENRPLSEVFAEAEASLRREGSNATAAEIVRSLREDRDGSRR